jgi:peptide/nickel transport system substrate-binding protein
VARQGAAQSLCTDHTPAYKPGYQDGVQCPKMDLAAANQLLAQAGWTMGPDGVRQKDGKRLEFQYSTTAGITWREQDQTINQANFKKIGIQVDIQNYPSSTFFSTFLRSEQPGKYDLAEWASSYSYDADDAANLACEQVGKSNFNYYCSAQLDALFRQEQSTADPGLRQQVFNQIHQFMLNELPIVSMFSPNDIDIVKKGTDNYTPGPFGASEAVNIWDWWCDSGKCPSAG